MAGNDTLATLGVDLVGRDISASATIDKVKAKATEATGTFADLGAAAGRVQAAVAKILMPAALVGSILGAVAAMKRFYDLVVEARKEIEKLNDAQAAGLQAGAASARGLNADLSEQLALERSISEQRAKLQEQFDKANGTMVVTLRTIANFPGVFAPFVDSVGQANEKLQAQIDAFNTIAGQQRDQLAAAQRIRAEREAAAEAEKVAAEAAKKAAEEAAEAASLRMSLEKELTAAQDARLSAADREIEQARRRYEELKALYGESSDSGLRGLIAALAQEQLDSVAAVHKAQMKAQEDEHRDRLRKIEETERKIRESLGGGIFGEGAVAGGNIGALTSAIAQIADKMGAR